MKQTAIIIGLILLLISPLAFGQQGTVINPLQGNPGGNNYIQITLTNTAADRTDDVYVMWPSTAMGYGWYLSETQPVAADRRKHRSFLTGDAYLCIEPNGTGGADDSLRVEMYPLVWDPVDKTYDTIDDDVRYLVFGNAGVYTAASEDYLDFTDGAEYAVPLGGLLMPCEGIKLDLDIDDNAAFSCVINIWFTVAQ